MHSLFRKNTRGISKDGRGGRGGKKLQKRPELIQTGGVFSEGLHSEISKKNRDSDRVCK